MQPTVEESYSCQGRGLVCADQMRKLELTLEAGTEEEALAVNLDKQVDHVREPDGRQRRWHLQMRSAVKEVSRVTESGSEEEAERENGQAAADSEAAAARAAAGIPAEAVAAATPVEELVE